MDDLLALSVLLHPTDDGQVDEVVHLHCVFRRLPDGEVGSQLFEHAVYSLFLNGGLVLRNAHGIEVAEFHERLQRNGRNEAGRVEVGQRDGGNPAKIQAFIFDGLGGEFLNDCVQGLVQQVAAAIHLLNDPARRLTLSESWNRQTTYRLPVRLVEVRLDVGIVQLDGNHRFARLALFG